MKPDVNSFFNITTAEEFSYAALSVFNYQAKTNPFYNKYINSLKVDINAITQISQIPFLPVEFFKTHQVIVKNAEQKLNDQIQAIEWEGRFQKKNNKPKISNTKLFTSSGTTGSATSKHYVSNVNIYEQSYLKGFQHFYGNVDDYCILALLPSYLEREGSSLIYMVNDLIHKSKHPQSGFYLNNYNDLYVMLKRLEADKQKTIVLGVSYALLDLAAYIDQKFPDGIVLKNTIVMETGGMKGKRREMLKEELHAILCKSFGVTLIHSEYGMTELLSQAYSKGNGIYYCPPWMKVMIREVNDPFVFLPFMKSGGINIIDLANINSCSFIATQDLGKSYPNNSFEILGRFDNSDIRGCNLLVG